MTATHISIRFLPWRMEVHESGTANAALDLWPDLPSLGFADILMAKGTDQILGVTFPVEDGSESLVRKFVSGVESPYLRYLSIMEIYSTARYEGYGSAARVELLWVAPESEIEVQAASLIDGGWIMKTDALRTNDPDGYIFEIPNNRHVKFEFS